MNATHLKSMYEGHLSIEGLLHSDVAFQQYVDNYGYGNDLCPEHGEITYVNGEVYCSVHSPYDGEILDGDGAGVPYL